jgi:hypothetical protein
MLCYLFICAFMCSRTATYARLSHLRLEPVRKNSCFSAIYCIWKRSFYQDRLGTNMGKALKKRPFFLRCEIMLDRCIGTCTLEWHKTTHCPGPFAVSRLSRLAMRPTVFHDRLRTDSTEKKIEGKNPNMAVCFRCNVHMPVYIR